MKSLLSKWLAYIAPPILLLTATASDTHDLIWFSQVGFQRLSEQRITRRPKLKNLASSIKGSPTRGRTSFDIRNVSDHFDGKTFFNPTLPTTQGHSLLKGFSYFLRSERVPWPKWVENHPNLRLHETLGAHQAAITFVNHSTMLIQLPGLNILTDPIWSDRAGPLSWLGVPRVREPGIPFDNLPKIDLVLVSHNHYDHMDLPTLQRLIDRFDPIIIVPIGNKSLIESLGSKSVYDVDWWDEIQVDDETMVTFAPTQHFTARGPFDRFSSLWGSFMIHTQGRRIYFGADSGYSVHYREIHQRLGGVDLAFLPIGAYEPRWFMEQMHVNPAEAVRAHEDLAAKQSIAIHFGTFHLSAEAMDQPPKDLNEALTKAGIPADRFIVPSEGQTMVLAM